MAQPSMATALFVLLLSIRHAITTASSSPIVKYNQRSFVIDWHPTLLLSGSIHYTRVPPSDW
jgi:hypothetical protein